MFRMQHRLNFSKGVHITDEVLNYVHSDCWGHLELKVWEVFAISSVLLMINFDILGLCYFSQKMRSLKHFSNEKLWWKN